MGTFRGHLFPGLGITLIGLWHTFNTIKAYNLKNSKKTTSNTWFPITIHSLPWLRPLELYLLLALTIITMSFTLHAYTITLELDNLEHTAIIFFFAIYAAAGIIIDLDGFSDELSGVVGLLFASAFANELFLVHCHSSDHVGLEGHYHWLFELILVVSLVTSTINTSLSSPESSYVSAMIRSMSIMAQGFWLMIMGFALYFPKFTPEGCYEARTNQAVACATEVAEKRAAGMANLEFSLMVLGVNVLVLMVSLWEWRGHGCLGYKRIQRAVIDEREVHEETKQLQP